MVRLDVLTSVTSTMILVLVTLIHDAVVAAVGIIVYDDDTYGNGDENNDDGGDK